MDDEKVDLSPLEPFGDRDQRERLVRALARRAADGVQHPVLSDLSRWARPVLAVAAALALLAWLPSLLDQRESADPASAILRWARRNEVPPTGELLTVLEARDGR
jgi:hypothetical protein